MDYNHEFIRKKTASNIVKMTEGLRFDCQTCKNVFVLFFTSLMVES